MTMNEQKTYLPNFFLFQRSSLAIGNAKSVSSNKYMSSKVYS